MSNENDICSIALDEAIGMCDDKLAVFKKMALVAGFTQVEMSGIKTIESSYAGIVSAGIPVGADVASPETRRWVLARAWEITAASPDVDVFSAFASAWEDARAEISSHPAYDSVDDADIDDHPLSDEFDEELTEDDFGGDSDYNDFGDAEDIQSKYDI